MLVVEEKLILLVMGNFLEFLLKFGAELFVVRGEVVELLLLFLLELPSLEKLCGQLGFLEVEVVFSLLVVLRGLHFPFKNIYNVYFFGLIVLFKIYIYYIYIYIRRRREKKNVYTYT